MLYSIGPVIIDTFPLPAMTADRTYATDFVAKDVLGAPVARPREYVGEGDEKLVIKGTILPVPALRLAGLVMLDMLHGVRRAAEPQPVMRGDFTVLGFYVVEAISEGHEFLDFTGVGSIVHHEITLTKVPGLSYASSYTLIGSILSLFG